MPAPTPPRPLNKADYKALSDFRYHLRRFLRASEDLIQSKGITPLQYCPWSWHDKRFEAVSVSTADRDCA